LLPERGLGLLVIQFHESPFDIGTPPVGKLSSSQTVLLVMAIAPVGLSARTELFVPPAGVVVFAGDKSFDLG
jgi:hypothetical protein